MNTEVEEWQLVIMKTKNKQKTLTITMETFATFSKTREKPIW